MLNKLATRNAQFINQMLTKNYKMATYALWTLT